MSSFEILLAKYPWLPEVPAVNLVIEVERLLDTMMKSLKGNATKNRHPLEKSNVERKRKEEKEEVEE